MTFFALSKSSGQVVVEYILLLIVAVAMAALVVKQIASRNPDDPGILIYKWHEIQRTIAEDLPDKCQGSGCR